MRRRLPARQDGPLPVPTPAPAEAHHANGEDDHERYAEEDRVQNDESAVGARLTLCVDITSAGDLGYACFCGNAGRHVDEEYS